MAKTPDKTSGIGTIGYMDGPPCAMAYTLNNQQPVLCTLLGDQPLFYMDFDFFEEEDEDLLCNLDYGLLDQEIRDLRERLDSYDRFTDGYREDLEKKVGRFLDALQEISRPDRVFLREHEPADLLETLRKSRYAAALIDRALDNRIRFRFDPTIVGAAYDRSNRMVLINSNLDPAEQLLLMARELRRAWQDLSGALVNPLVFHPDNAIVINRAREADLAVSMVRIGWELQLADEKMLWERIENSSLSDLGRAFAREAYLDFRTLNNGAAAGSVFEAWFLSERCQKADRILIQSMLSDYEGHVFNSEEASRNVSVELIAALGEMPYGKNYLAKHAQVILSDAVFTDVRDRANANFLWFIKFEKSFRETEQGLQMETGLDAQDDRSAFSRNPINALSDLSEDDRYEHTADIIKFDRFTDRRSASTGTGASELRPGGADIIFIHRN